MGVTNYYVVGGSIIGQKATGTSRIDNLTDALGSVTATVDQTGTVQNTYRYKPYGTQLVKSGTTPDPIFTWAGTFGYRQTTAKYTDVYVRARHYSSSLSTWATTDPKNTMGSDRDFSFAPAVRRRLTKTWQRSNGFDTDGVQSVSNRFAYAFGSPTGLIDFTGLLPCRLKIGVACIACYYYGLIRIGIDPTDACKFAAQQCRELPSICDDLSINNPPTPNLPPLPEPGPLMFPCNSCWDRCQNAYTGPGSGPVLKTFCALLCATFNVIGCKGLGRWCQSRCVKARSYPGYIECEMCWAAEGALCNGNNPVPDPVAE